MRLDVGKFMLLAVILTLGLTASYWNHFDNGFYFDDTHTIVNNEYIRSLDYVPEYFTNIETFGTMPNNRGYRPMVTLLNAIDYRLGGNTLDPVTFHISIWFWYLVQGLLLFLFFTLGICSPESFSARAVSSTTLPLALILLLAAKRV